jgi:hypothetical protein
LVVAVSTLNGTMLLLIARSRLRRDASPVVLPWLQQACKEAGRERPSCRAASQVDDEWDEERKQAKHRHEHVAGTTQRVVMVNTMKK